MLELLNSNLEIIDIYYNPLQKYFIRDCIKLEDQIKSRKAGWLLAVKHYIRQNEFYNTDAEILVEFRKTYTDKKGKISFTSYWVKRKDRWPVQHRLRQESLRNWKIFLVNEYQSVEVHYV